MIFGKPVSARLGMDPWSIRCSSMVVENPCGLHGRTMRQTNASSMISSHTCFRYSPRLIQPLGHAISFYSVSSSPCNGHWFAGLVLGPRPHLGFVALLRAVLHWPKM